MDRQRAQAFMQKVVDDAGTTLAAGLEFVGDRLENNRDAPFGRLLYAISCLHCVPQSLAPGGPGLGACWGPSRARELAQQAGFSVFEELPIRSPAQAFCAIRA